ncbi:hypothetical protein DL98DRAFT_591028 [Cadophora sp. DSE1049]|nr:hypothetical protein DL98DRAFT_591028 [Cadophora sp. DSE1049]
MEPGCLDAQLLAIDQWVTIVPEKGPPAVSAAAQYNKSRYEQLFLKLSTKTQWTDIWHMAVFARKSSGCAIRLYPDEYVGPGDYVLKIVGTPNGIEDAIETIDTERVCCSRRSDLDIPVVDKDKAVIPGMGKRYFGGL